MSSDYETLRAESQTQLLDFLRAELEIGFTFVQSAVLAASEHHTDHSIQAKANALKAVEAIRRFLSRLVDPAARIEIERELAKLDSQISKL